MVRGLTLMAFLVGAAGFGQAPSAREGLRPLGVLVGVWRGTGAPFGSREEQQKGFWVEKIACEWKFKGADAWLSLTFDESKRYKAGELRFLADKNLYQFTVKAPDGKTTVLRGELANKILTLTTDDGGERIVVTLLHDNRFLYRAESRLDGKASYTKKFQVGATKEGVPFAAGAGPECVVTGGLGTMAVTYLGKTYYVCCGGCRDEFNADPARYVKEFEAKRGSK